MMSLQNILTANNPKASALIDEVRALVKSDLAPIANDIDQKGLYPIEFIQKLGHISGYSAAIPESFGGQGLDLATQIAITTQVGRECGSTAFLVWCQSSCAQYLLHAPNADVRTRYLNDVSTGKRLSGTGMSNTVKHLAGIENIHLKAQRNHDGYVISGSLPWVSNIGQGHLAIVAAAVEDEGYVMFVVDCDAPGVTLKECPEFSALEGTRTLSIRFKAVQIADQDVLAHPHQFKTFINTIKPVFVMGQLGMGFGVIEGSLKTIRESNIITAHVNQFLDDPFETIESEAAALYQQTKERSDQLNNGQIDLLDVLRLRLATSELSLRAANSAILHAGAKGFLMRHPAQRRLREAVFVAIVTPALKHLRKEIHALEQQDKGVQAA